MTNEPEIIETTDVPETEVSAGPEGTTNLDAVRELVLRAHPEVVPELIGGETIEALLASVEPAEAAWRRLAERIERPPAAPAVPAGGARPAAVDPDRLPASEKIRRGLARNPR
jgi:hypothetical protein